MTRSSDQVRAACHATAASFLLLIALRPALADDLNAAAGSTVNSGGVARQATPVRPAAQATQATQAKQAVAAQPNPLERAPQIKLSRPVPSADLVVGTTTKRAPPTLSIPGSIAGGLVVDRNKIGIAIGAGMTVDPKPTPSPMGDTAITMPGGDTNVGIATPEPGQPLNPEPPLNSFPDPGVGIPRVNCSSDCDDGATSDRLRREAESSAVTLVERSSNRGPTYANTRSAQEELAAQAGAISRLTGGQPVQAWSPRGIQWQLMGPPDPPPAPAKVQPAQSQQPAQPPAGPAVAAVAGNAPAAKGPCVPTRNPEYDNKLRQREQLIVQGKALPASAQEELAAIERAIEEVERELWHMDAYLDPCNGEEARKMSDAASKKDVPVRPELWPHDTCSTDTHRAIASGEKELGQTTYEESIRGLDGAPSWNDLPKDRKDYYRSRERTRLGDADARSVSNWRERMDRRDDQARSEASAHSRVQLDKDLAKIHDQQLAAERKAAARKTREARANAIEELNDKARALNRKLQDAKNSGDQDRQRAIERALDDISTTMTTQYLPLDYERAAMDKADQARLADQKRQKAAAATAATTDERQRRMDEKRDIEAQNRSVGSRAANYTGGVITGACKTCVEVPLTAVDAVTAVTNGGPKRSAIGQVIASSDGVGDFGSKIAVGIGHMFTHWCQDWSTGNMRDLGEDTFNIATLLAPRCKAANAEEAAAGAQAGSRTLAVHELPIADQRAIAVVRGDGAMKGVLTRRRGVMPDDLDDLPPPGSVPPELEPGALSRNLSDADRARLNEPFLSPEDARLRVDMKVAEALERLGRAPRPKPVLPGWNGIAEGKTVLEPGRGAPAGSGTHLDSKTLIDPKRVDKTPPPEGQ